MEALAEELKSDTCKKNRKVSLSLGESGLDITGDDHSYTIKPEDMLGIGLEYSNQSVMILPVPVNIPMGGRVELKIRSPLGVHLFLQDSMYKHKTEGKAKLLEISSIIMKHTFNQRVRKYLQNLKDNMYFSWAGFEIHMNTKINECSIKKDNKKVVLKDYYVTDDDGKIVFSNSRIFGTKMKLDKAEVDFDVVMEILHKYFNVRRDILKV